MKRFFYYIVGIWALVLLTGCSQEEEGLDNHLSMPIRLYVSVNDGGQPHRAPGDPGVPENYQLPRYLYVYFAQKIPTTPNPSKNLDFMEEDLDPKLWKPVPDPNTPGLYAYEGHLSMMLSKKNITPTNDKAQNETAESRVYAIASYDPLTFTRPGTFDEVPELKLDLLENSRIDLMNVYANPLGGDRNNGAVTKRGEFLYETEVTCYHVAARIDVQWDINPKKQGTYKMKTIELKNLPTQGFFFHHTDNTKGTGTQTFTADVGNQWYGRHVFHAFDRKEVECTYTLSQKGSTTDKVIQKTYTKPTTVSHSDVYASWYRINATFGYLSNP